MHLGRDKIPPSVADLIPGTERTVNFDDEIGNVNIKSVMDITKLILNHGLNNHHGISIKGKARLCALVNGIRDKGHSFKTLSEADLETMVGGGISQFADANRDDGDYPCTCEKQFDWQHMPCFQLHQCRAPLVWAFS